MRCENDNILNNFKDYYALLGIERRATEREVRLAFLRLVRKYHPDKNMSEFKLEQENDNSSDKHQIKSSNQHGIIVKYHALYEAYSTLKDPARRSEYDTLLFNKGITKKQSWHKVLNLSKLEYFADENSFSYSCNCGEIIIMEKKYIEDGINLFPCDSCSTKITITL